MMKNEEDIMSMNDLEVDTRVITNDLEEQENLPYQENVTEEQKFQQTSLQLAEERKEQCFVETGEVLMMENVVDAMLMNDLEVDTSRGNCVITDEMIEQENLLYKENVTEEQKLQQMSLQEDEKKEQCFKRLQHLLNRSSIYANFLAQRLEKQEAEAQQKKEKEVLKKERQKLKPIQGHGKSTLDLTRNRKRGRQENILQEEVSNKMKKHNSGEGRKQKTNGVLISDFFNKKDLKNHVPQTEEGTVEVPDTFSRTFSGVSVSDRQPNLLTGGILRPYQLDGFEWLKLIYENGVNGILADEMGLGKTAQSIALIAHLVQMGVPGPFLICAPLSTLPNWLAEFQRFAPDIPVLLYHGSIIDRKQLRKGIETKTTVNAFEVRPVVITSYSMVIQDRAKFSKVFFKYAIIDEGHRIKNYQCRLIKELKQYKSTNWLLLTGTPLQNNLAELWSLLHFILPEIFNDLNVFESWFDISLLTRDEGDQEIVSQEQEKHVISTIHQILTPFLLRRTKADVSLELPPKKEIIVYAPLTPLQQTYYNGVINRTIGNLLDREKQMESPITFVEGRAKRKLIAIDYNELNDGSDSEENDELLLEQQSSSNADSVSKVIERSIITLKMKNILMMLRKICLHPYLISYPLDPHTKDYLINEDLIKQSGKLLVLDSMLPELKKRGHKILIFSQMVKMLDILQDYCIFRNFNIHRLDGKLNLEERQEQIKDFNENPSSFLFLISTRAGGLGINLASADTVIIYDSDWNPQCDLQAQDRCHRIGQTKPVVVYRLIIEKTVDEKIIEKANAKRKLEKMIIQQGRFSTNDTLSKSQKALVPEELLELLQSSDVQRSVKSKDGNLFSKSELDMLLDRSDMIIQTGSEQLNKTKHREVQGVFKVISETTNDKL